MHLLIETILGLAFCDRLFSATIYIKTVLLNGSSSSYLKIHETVYNSTRTAINTLAAFLKKETFVILLLCTVNINQPECAVKAQFNTIIQQ